MSALSRRIDRLETGANEVLSPAVKAWLGHKLTAAEQREADAAPDFDQLDLSGLSKEARAWLGVD